jgi:predicted HD phosphohydrolase
VGDGNNLNIWADPWLPRDGSRKLITPIGATLLHDVSDLVSPIAGTWDEELVKDIFSEEDAKLILGIRVHEGSESMIARHYDP